MADKPFFVVPLPLGTVTTGNERANRPASHLGEHMYRGMIWQSSGTANLWVRGDMGSAKAIDFISLMGTNAVAGTTIRVRLGDTQAEVDGTADYDSGTLPLINPTPAATPSQGYHSHLELPSLQSKRWWRIDIGGHTGDFGASMLVLGRKIKPSVYYEGQHQRGVRDLAGVTFSRNGVPGQSAGVKMRTQAAKWSWITEAEMETLVYPALEGVGKSSPLFLSFDPEATSYRQARTFMGLLEDQPAMTKIGFNRHELSLQLLSFF